MLVDEAFSAIKESIDDGFETIDEDFKLNRIQNAIMLIDETTSFNVHVKTGERYYEYASSLLLKNILFSFMSGHGWYIDNYIESYSFPTDYNGEDYHEKHVQHHKELHEKLRRRLEEQIYELTGTAPVSKLEDDRWIIYHG